MVHYSQSSINFLIFFIFTDGHKLILIEGIPTIFSWENIEQFNGNKIKNH